MLASNPDQKPRRTDRKTCHSCGCTAAGCRGVEWLGGRRCCASCDGDHDGPETA